MVGTELLGWAAARRARLAAQAQSRGDWGSAGRHYKAALRYRPRAAALWVQFGHALKESGRYAAAETAYRRAIALQGGIADSHLQVGHVLKLQGRMQEAAGEYLTAHILEPHLPFARLELESLGCPTIDELDRLRQAERGLSAELEQHRNRHFAEMNEALNNHFAEIRPLEDALRGALSELDLARTGHFAEMEEAQQSHIRELRVLEGALATAHRQHLEIRELLEFQLGILRRDLQRGDSFRAELVSTKVRMDGLVQENAALNAALAAAKSELEEWQMRERGYREAQDALEARIAGFRGDIRTASSKISELEKTTERLNGQVGAAERELAEARHELSASREKAQAAEVAVSRLEAEITTLNSQSETTRQALSEAQQELAAAQCYAGEKEARAAQLEAEVDELKGRIETLNSAMAEAQNELSAAQARTAEAEANSARLQGEVERAQAAIVEVTRKAEHFERGAAEREVLQVELAERQERIDRLSMAQADAERALQIALDDRERAARELASERARLGSEKEELALRLHQLEAGPKPSPAAMEVDFGRLQLQVASEVSLLSSELDRLRRAMQPKESDGSNHGPSIEVLREAYIDLLENTLTGRLYVSPKIAVSNGNARHGGGIGTADWYQSVQGKSPIALARMRNIRRLLESVLADSVSGDLLETGSRTGGGSIYMRGLLAAYGVTDRRVWVADVFPEPTPSEDTSLAADEHEVDYTLNEVTATIEEVKADFRRYNLLDGQVVFLAGCLKDTLPKTSKRLALLRLDGDVYQSIFETLDTTYRRLSPGGYVIVDDYMLPGPLKAVHDFRDQYGIVEELQTDGAAAFWRKGS